MNFNAFALYLYWLNKNVKKKKKGVTRRKRSGSLFLIWGTGWEEVNSGFYITFINSDKSFFKKITILSRAVNAARARRRVRQSAVRGRGRGLGGGRLWCFNQTVINGAQKRRRKGVRVLHKQYGPRRLPPRDGRSSAEEFHYFRHLLRIKTTPRRL